MSRLRSRSTAPPRPTPRHTRSSRAGRSCTITKTFAIRYRPSSASAGESRYLGSDGQYHNGIAQTITFPVNRKLGNDVVWAVGYNTNTSGPRPTGVAGPADSLNVGLVPAVRIGHDRFPNSLFWDTRSAGFTGGAPFVTGQLNLDGGSWTDEAGRLVSARRGAVRRSTRPRRNAPLGAIRPGRHPALIESCRLGPRCHAPGRIRTCDFALRRRALYPLSYRRGSGDSTAYRPCGRRRVRSAPCESRPASTPSSCASRS